MNIITQNVLNRNILLVTKTVKIIIINCVMWFENSMPIARSVVKNKNLCERMYD